MRQNRTRILVLLKDIAAYILVGLLAAFAFFILYYRPHNPLAFPGIEEKLLSALLFAAAATATVSAIIALPLLDKLYARISRSRLLQKAASNPTVRAAVRMARTAARWTGHYFDPSSRWFFVFAGVAGFLAALPFILLQLKDVVGAAFPFFFLYILFSLKKGLDNRVLVVTGLLLLASCPVLLSFSQDAMADLSAIIAYYCLSNGILLQFVDYVKNRDRYGKG